MRAGFVVAQTGKPVLFTGMPGTGKTSIIFGIAAKWGCPCVRLIVSQHEATDIGGFPHIIFDTEVGHIVERAPLKWVKYIANRRSILFLDEITDAKEPQQAAVLTLLAERWVGDISIGPEPIIILAGNPVEYSANGAPMTAPMANRICHFAWEPDCASWLSHMMTGEFVVPDVPILPDTWREHIPRARAMIGLFLDRKRELINRVPKPEELFKAYPTQRSWTYAADALAACWACKLTPEEEHLAVAACVGDGPAGEFADWLTNLDLPDVEDILHEASIRAYKWPKKYTRLDQVLAILTSAAHAVRTNFTPDRYRALDRVMLAAHAANYSEAVVLSLQIIVKARPEVRELISRNLTEGLGSFLAEALVK